MKAHTTMHLLGLAAAALCGAGSASVARAKAVVHYTLNEGGGTAFDTIGGVHMDPINDTAAEFGLRYNQPGVPAGTYGAVTITPAMSASFGTAVRTGQQFDNGASFVNRTPNNALNTLQGPFTVTAWINPDAVNEVVRIFASGPATLPDGKRTGWGFGLIGNTTAGATSTNQRFTTYGRSDINQTSGAQVTLGQWQHVAASYTPAGFAADGVTPRVTIQYHLNGNPVQSLTANAFEAVNPNAAFGLFSSNTGSETFGGTIDDVWVYDTALTTAEIRLAATGAEVITVPEPAAAAGAVGAGLLALGVRRRRRPALA